MFMSFNVLFATVGVQMRHMNSFLVPVWLNCSIKATTCTLQLSGITHVALVRTTAPGRRTLVTCNYSENLIKFQMKYGNCCCI